MRPILFHVGPIGIPTHDFFVLVGVVTAVAVFFHEARRRGVLSEPLVWVVVGALFWGAIGTRAGLLWGHLDAGSSVGHEFLEGGKSVLSGLTGAYVGVLLTKRLLRYPSKTGDLFAPAVAAGMATGRWGCFLTEQIGTPTAMPWGVTLSPSAAARIPECASCVAGVALHPSFLYEIAFHALMFGVLVCLRARVSVPGELLKIYLLAYAVFRFAVEFVRGNEIVFQGLTRSQLFLIPSGALLIGYFLRQLARGVYINTPEVAT